MAKSINELNSSPIISNITGFSVKVDEKIKDESGKEVVGKTEVKGLEQTLVMFVHLRGGKETKDQNNQLHVTGDFQDYFDPNNGKLAGVSEYYNSVIEKARLLASNTGGNFTSSFAPVLRWKISNKDLEAYKPMDTWKIKFIPEELIKEYETAGYKLISADYIGIETSIDKPEEKKKGGLRRGVFGLIEFNDEDGIPYYLTGAIYPEYSKELSKHIVIDMPQIEAVALENVSKDKDSYDAFFKFKKIANEWFNNQLSLSKPNFDISEIDKKDEDCIALYKKIVEEMEKAAKAEAEKAEKLKLKADKKAKKALERETQKAAKQLEDEEKKKVEKVEVKADEKPAQDEVEVTDLLTELN